MKTRIISAAVMIGIVAVFLILGLAVSSLFIGAFIAVIAAIGVFELVNNAAQIDNKTVKISAVVYAVVTVFIKLMFKEIAPNLSSSAVFGSVFTSTEQFLYDCALAVYFLICVVIILIEHKSFDLGKIFTVSAAVPLLVKGFCYLGGIISYSNGIYYLLLLLTFSCICDSGAYFSGVFLGKHKLCPEISPKKTVEGAAGGIISSVVVVIILMVCFKSTIDYTVLRVIATLVLTIPLCIVGMLGDLFASQVKRSVGLKDYGNLIPGHGGILDRFDSMLLISPVLYILMCGGVI